MSDISALKALAENARAWPFEEAKKLVARAEKMGKSEVLFETGYGPSGLPHIGTFGEVARTAMVRHAFETLTGGAIKTRLICFSDDMDGLRKVPTNVPNQEMLTPHLNKPLTRVPDPFGTHESFAHHNNARLCAFLDQFGFEYEFYSATDCYTSGRFDDALLGMLKAYDKVMDIILPTLGQAKESAGEDRRTTYSPFLPLCPRTGHVLQVPMVARDEAAGTVSYIDPETGETVTTPVTGGRVKCQWKADWAMRWVALGVDYEMAGKDLIDSVKLSSQIARALGGTPPEGFNYELFLDDEGKKISKSKGNGLTIEEWLSYASPESLSLYMFQAPKKAKRLYFDVIPKAVDEYLTFVEKAHEADEAALLENPAWHIHSGEVPAASSPVSFAMLLNLVSASNAEEPSVLWGFIRAYAPDASPENNPKLDELVGYAIRYFHDFVKPGKTYRLPTEMEAKALEDLKIRLKAIGEGETGENYQTLVYQIGKDHGFENLRDWFVAIYQVLLGQDQGPRFGNFIELYGVGRTEALIEQALKGKLAG